MKTAGATNTAFMVMEIWWVVSRIAADHDAKLHETYCRLMLNLLTFY